MKNVWITRLQTALLLLFIFVLFQSCSKERIEEDIPEIVKNASVTKQDLIEGHYIVIVSEEPAKKNAKAAAVLEELSKELKSKPGARLKQTYRHALTGFAAELTDKQVQKLARDPRVEYIEQDGYIYLNNTISVQEYCTWGLDRIDQRGSALDRAYVSTTTGNGVTAYIMDSGIRGSHDEFEGRVSMGKDFVVSNNPEDTDPNQEPGEDCMGHGTHVAGTVGGLNFGVAKGINLVSVRVFGCTGISSRSIYVAAIDWITANANGPSVVNMSLGFSNDSEHAQATDAALENSINAGINYVVAAGNNAGDACEITPAKAPRALTVGATEIGDNKAGFSNFGDCVDIYAPGSNITSASYEDDTSFFALSGTSMSAPHVTGLVGLYLERNPEATPAEVHAAIIENSTPDAVNNVPYGTRNMVYSLWAPVEFTQPTPPDLNLKAYGFKEGKNTTIHLDWEPTNDPFINVYRNGKYFARWYNDGRYKLQTNGKGNDRFMVCEENYDNCSAEVVANFDDTGDFVPNISPVPGFTYTVDGLQVQFTDTSTDEDGTIISWTWYFGDGNRSTRQNPTYTYNEPGTYRVEFMVQDDYHDTQYIIEYISVGDLNANQAPTAGFAFNNSNLNVQFTDTSTDPDGSVVAWSWDFGDGNTSSTKDPAHSYSAAGTYDVSLTVTDDAGDTDSTIKSVVVSTEEPNPGTISLSGTGYKVKGEWHADLSWDYTGAVDIYREGEIVASLSSSDGTYTDVTGMKGSGSLNYRVCEAGNTANCSDAVRVEF